MKPFVNPCLALVLAFTSLAAPAEDARVRQLELDVAQLRREVMAQARRIDELERQTTRPVRRPGQEADAPLAAPAHPKWLVAANWERVRLGMLESDVVQLLGPPTSIRAGDGAGTKTLFYALEVAPDAYLAGGIELGNDRVTAVKKPVLR